MNEELNQCCVRLQEEVKNAETCLSRIDEHLVSPELTPLSDWKALLQEAAEHLSAKREPARQSGERVKAWMEEIENGAKTPLDESNLDGEILRVENQADREEGLALDALVVATHAILQAEVAVLKAFTTRKTAVDLARLRNVF